VFGRKKATASEEENREFKLIWADWSDQKFRFSHPDLKTHTINNADVIEGQFQLLEDTPKLNLGWHKVPGNKIVVTLVHKTGSIFSEVYVLNLNTKRAAYYSQNTEVVVTA
jgi:hypothetical protein